MRTKKSKPKTSAAVCTAKFGICPVCGGKRQSPEPWDEPTLFIVWQQTERHIFIRSVDLERLIAELHLKALKAEPTTVRAWIERRYPGANHLWGQENPVLNRIQNLLE